MIIILTIVFVAMVVLGFYLISDWEYEYWGIAPTVIGSLGAVISLTVLVFLLVDVSTAHTIDDRIAMYETENAKIESQIVDVITQYQQYEKEIFAEVTPDSAMTLVSLYPELKSDVLVAKQIEVYIGNNEKIKSLKEEKITTSVKKWWLYFGGE